MKAKNKLFLLAMCMLLMLVLVFFSETIFPDSNQINMSQVLKAPGPGHPFGTDFLGRDVLHRTFNGMKISLGISLSIQALSLAAGVVAGSVAGYYGGVLDRLYLAVNNVLQAFPGVIASLCMILLLGPGIPTLILAISLLQWNTYARLARSQTLALKESEFVLGAVGIGASGPYLILRHIIPNVLRPVFPLFTIMIGHTVLTISGLGFLGFGIQPPSPEIGLMISDSMSYLAKAPWLLLCPGLTLGFYVFVINALGDRLRDMAGTRQIIL